ncbi:CHAT domain-containing protein [Geodermatophilus saharensis]|uniref:CHAT domain-containing protein n=1 Tax=Geodermatophilus saharensis TaxID=1137994 RepID=A0A239C5D5_9ACTN|nr:CHAT domain-containing protein [Geodermatophilus saharensis]SNS14861.1 CHAT domain-containing protein [Geodermatophilus saharensis]
MQTALIRVEALSEGGYEARLALPADGVMPPGPDAPRVTFTDLPTPTGAPDLATLMLETKGTSDEFVTMGRALYDTVLRDDIHDALTAAKAGQEGVRLLFDIVPDKLKTLPWELLRYDTQRLFTDARNPAARVAATYTTASPATELCWPLRVMIVVGSKDPNIGVEEEIRHIRDAFRSVCGLVDLEVLRLPSRSRIREECEAMKPHVFHFIGHGGRNSSGGFLILDQTGGNNRPWTASDIRDDLSAAPPRVAMLNACHSGAGEQEGTWAAAAGLADLRVPAVIAMQGPIRGDAAAHLARDFFGSLAKGQPLDVAMARARVAVTDVAGDRQREYALPCLILGAPPEHILDLSADPTSKLVEPPLRDTVFFVDRLPNRRHLWDRLGSSTGQGPRIFAVTGPMSAGKGSLVRWGLGVAYVRGHPVAHADFSGDSAVGSVDFLDQLSLALPAELVEVDRTAHEAFRAEVLAFRYEQQRARADNRVFDRTPRELYSQFRKLLATITVGGTLVVGIDGIDGVERGEWQDYAVPELVQPIARGRLAGVRLLVSLRETERRTRFSPQSFTAGQVQDFPLQLFPSDQLTDLLAQWLRARNFVASSFQRELADLESEFAGRPWSTELFELLELKAAVAKWPTEP